MGRSSKTRAIIWRHINLSRCQFICSSIVVVMLCAFISRLVSARVFWCSLLALVFMGCFVLSTVVLLFSYGCFHPCLYFLSTIFKRFVYFAAWEQNWFFNNWNLGKYFTCFLSFCKIVDLSNNNNKPQAGIRSDTRQLDARRHAQQNQPTSQQPAASSQRSHSLTVHFTRFMVQHRESGRTEETVQF